VIRNGSSGGRRREECRGCGRFFGDTAGTPMSRLHTEAREVAQALLIVMRRGSFRAAEEITGHTEETSGEWVRRASQGCLVLPKVLKRKKKKKKARIDRHELYHTRRSNAR
jgi:transposase-like protein